MKKNLVILGNQFLCEKRMLNIVQRTVIMEDDAIDVYIHNHQLFKDQRAIIVDPDVPVRTGHIFTGDAFVDPVNFTRTPIEGEIEEEEMESTAAKTNAPEIIKWLENIMNEIRSIKGNYGNVPKTAEIDTRMELINRMNSIHNAGYGFGRLMNPIMYYIKEGNVNVYAEPSIESELLGYFKDGDKIVATAYNDENNFILLNNGGYVKFDVKRLYILGTVRKMVTHTETGKITAYLDGYNSHSPVIPDGIKNENTIPYCISEMNTVSQMRCCEGTTENVVEDNENTQKAMDEEYTKEEKLRILIDEEYSVKDIAKEFNVNTSTVYKWMKKYGIKRSAN